MPGREMLTKLDAGMLAEAFPSYARDEAMVAAEAVASQLSKQQWTERFAICVEREELLIPARLYFSSGREDNEISGDAWLMARCLRTRSNDGFERQRAARDVLSDVRSWSAPFILALMGEYVVEILADVEAAMSPSVEDHLVNFISANPGYWQLTKQRIASYWNVYYRHSSKRSEYVGFKLADQLEARNRDPILQR